MALERMRHLSGGFVLLIGMLGAVSCAANGSGDGELQPPDDPLQHVELFEPDLDYSQVVYVVADETSPDVFTFSVTLRHEDEGWDHYADLWEVVNPEDGAILGERILAHPHDDEQPFTRSQSGISIPDGLDRVVVRSKCTVHGYGGRAILVDLAGGVSDYYEVQS